MVNGRISGFRTLLRMIRNVSLSIIVGQKRNREIFKCMINICRVTVKSMVDPSFLSHLKARKKMALNFNLF